MLSESSLKPKRSATSRMASWPRSMAAWENGVLQDCAKIQVKSAESRWLQIPPPKLVIGVLVWGRSSSFGMLSEVSGEYSPDSSMATASMRLNVEPGAVAAVGGRAADVEA